MPNITGATSFFPRAAENSAPMTLTSSISAGATVVPITGLLVNYAAGDVVVFTIDPSSTTLKQVFTGTVASDSTVTGVTWTVGTNQPHTLGATIIDNASATHIDLITKGITTQHSQSGAHTNISATSITTTGNSTVGGSQTVAGTLAVTGTSSLRIAPRISASASTATLTPNIDSFNIYDLTAQAAALTLANPTGTPNNGDILIIRLKDNGTSQTISYGTAYTNISGLSNLAATVVGKWHVIGMMYNAATTGWQIVSITTSA
jgi:ribosomal protein L21E